MTAPMTREELLPCPFCGEKRIFLNEPSQHYRYGSINCPACLVVMPGEVRDRDELIRCWNGRELPDSAQQPWRPISTAPTHETVLVAGGDAIYPVTASWDGDTMDGWWVDGQEDVHEQIGWPTHWMPLPASPEQTVVSSTSRGAQPCDPNDLRPIWEQGLALPSKDRADG